MAAAIHDLRQPILVIEDEQVAAGAFPQQHELSQFQEAASREFDDLSHSG